MPSGGQQEQAGGDYRGKNRRTPNHAAWIDPSCVMLALRMRRPRQVLVATNAEELVANRRDPNGHATLVYGRPGAASLGRRGLSRWPDRSALHPPDYSTHQTTPPSRKPSRLSTTRIRWDALVPAAGADGDAWRVRRGLEHAAGAPVDRRADTQQGARRHALRREEGRRLAGR